MGVLTKQKKSGDARLQDAAAANAESRSEDHGLSPTERLERLPSEVQDAAEQKRAQGDHAGAARADAAVAALTKTVEMLLSRMEAMEQKPSQPTVRGTIHLMKCSTCGQYLLDTASSRGVCTGVHVPAFIAPITREFWADFDGIIINGVRYRGHVQLPLAMADEVKAHCSRWEAMERKKKIAGGRNIGSDALGGLPIVGA